MEEGLERVHPGHLHDQRSVDAEEAGGVQLSLYPSEGLADQVRLSPGVDPYVFGSASQ